MLFHWRISIFARANIPGKNFLWGAIQKKVYWDGDQRCAHNFEQIRETYGELWHVCTPGNLQEIINVSAEDFKFSVSNMAISSFETGVMVITDAHMENHIHELVACSREKCFDLMGEYTLRLSRYLKKKGRVVRLEKFKCEEPIHITSLKSLRNELIYINRNGYVVNPKYTPFSYPWGGGNLYFNPFAKAIQGTRFNELPFKMKREIMFKRVFDLPEHFSFLNGMVLPSSYVNVKVGESVFRDSHHYVSSVFKNVESYSSEARSLGDSVVLTREEMYDTVKEKCKKEYSVDFPTMLTPEDKMVVARMMHFDYHATNAQIRMILGMPANQVDTMFPKVKTLK